MDQINCCCCCCCCYIGLFSKIADNKIGYLVKKYCKDLDVELDISSFKVGNLFSVKDSVPDKLRSRVVYKFSCAGCSARYVGETSRHFTTRVREHLSTDRVSHVYKHLQNSDKCRNLCTEKNFIILDSASTVFQLKIKEALHIQWQHGNISG